jgi:hypothetical protein
VQQFHLMQNPRIQTACSLRCHCSQAGRLVSAAAALALLHLAVASNPVVRTAVVRRRDIEKMSNLVSDSDAGSDWNPGRAYGAPHAVTGGHAGMGAPPSSLLGQVRPPQVR